LPRLGTKGVFIGVLSKLNQAFVIVPLDCAIVPPSGIPVIYWFVTIAPKWHNPEKVAQSASLSSRWTSSIPLLPILSRHGTKIVLHLPGTSPITVAPKPIIGFPWFPVNGILFPVKKAVFPVKSDHFPVKNHPVSGEDGGFPVKTYYFPVKNYPFAVKKMVFPVK
jgi:hypothetical protein